MKKEIQLFYLLNYYYYFCSLLCISLLTNISFEALYKAFNSSIFISNFDFFIKNYLQESLKASGKCVGLTSTPNL